MLFHVLLGSRYPRLVLLTTEVTLTYTPADQIIQHAHRRIHEDITCGQTKASLVGRPKPSPYNYKVCIRSRDSPFPSHSPTIYLHGNPRDISFLSSSGFQHFSLISFTDFWVVAWHFENGRKTHQLCQPWYTYLWLFLLIYTHYSYAAVDIVISHRKPRRSQAMYKLVCTTVPRAGGMDLTNCPAVNKSLYLSTAPLEK